MIIIRINYYNVMKKRLNLKKIAEKKTNITIPNHHVN